MVTVAHLSDGKFRNIGPVYGRLEFGLQGCVRLDFTDLPIQLLVTGRCHDTTDPDDRCVGGIELGAIRLLAMKAKRQPVTSALARPAPYTVCAPETLMTRRMPRRPNRSAPGAAKPSLMQRTRCSTAARYGTA